MVNHLKQSEKIITELIDSEFGIKYNILVSSYLVFNIYALTIRFSG